MRSRQKTASDYSPDGLLRIRQTCLYVVSSIPAALADDITVVGGLVPSLLIGDLHASGEQHLGTADLDIGFALGVRGAEHYEELVAKLAELGFRPERTEHGKPASERWTSGERIPAQVIIDVLPVVQTAGDLSSNTGIPGLELSNRTGFAFRDRVSIEIDGPCITGENRRAKIWVCGPGAYIIIKSLTFAQRNLYKDAYDLFYVLKNYGNGVQDVVTRLAPLLHGAAEGQRALRILRDDFADPNGDGAKAVPLFLYRHADDDLQADVAGYAYQLLAFFGMTP